MNDFNINDYIFNNDDGSKSLFLKFSNKCALNNMYDGEFWFRPYCYYWAVEGTLGDEREGLVCNVNKVSDSAIFKNGTVMLFDYDGKEFCRMFSFYEVKLKDKYFEKIDEKMKEFGDYVSLLNMNLLIKELEDKYNVIYVQSPKYDEGIIDKFHFYKDSTKYKYQSEKRIAIKTNKQATNEEIKKLERKIDVLQKKCRNILNLKEIDSCKKKLFDLYKNEKFTHKIEFDNTMISKPVYNDKIFEIDNLEDLQKLFYF